MGKFSSLENTPVNPPFHPVGLREVSADRVASMVVETVSQQHSRDCPASSMEGAAAGDSITWTAWFSDSSISTTPSSPR